MPKPTPPISNLQLTVLRELCQARVGLRWYGHRHPQRAFRGRGFVTLRGNETGEPLANYSVRALIRAGYISPINATHRRPFTDPDPKLPIYRDYNITERGRRAANYAKEPK